MARSDPPPVNPYASPQAADETAVQDIPEDVLQLRRELQGMRLLCYCCGGLQVSALATLIFSGPLLHPAGLGMAVFTSFYWSSIVGVNLAALLSVVRLAAKVQGPWFGLLCSAMLLILGGILVVGYFLTPLLIERAAKRRYVHLLPARDN